MLKNPSPTKELSNSLTGKQLDCDQVSFFVGGKTFEELTPQDVGKHNCLHLIDVLAKFDAVIPEDEFSHEILRTEVVPDLLVYALQLAYVSGRDPIDALLKQSGTIIDETPRIATLNELRVKILESQSSTPEAEDIQKTVINAASHLARICDENDHGTTLPADEISTNVAVPLFMASMQLSELLKVDLDTAWRQRIEQIKEKHGNVRFFLDKRASLFEVSGPAILPTEHGQWKLYGFKDMIVGKTLEATALVLGEIDGQDDVLVRLHSQCITSEVLRSLRCDCKDQLDSAIQAIVSEGRGMVIYVFEEGRGIGIFNKVAAYAEQDGGKDTIDANIAIGQPVEGRRFQLEGKIVQYFNPESIALITNNPDKISAMEKVGVAIKRIVGTKVPNNPHCIAYIETKRERLNHKI
jgi:GTP cyclohydrolase II